MDIFKLCQGVIMSDAKELLLHIVEHINQLPTIVDRIFAALESVYFIYYFALILSLIQIPPFL